MNKDTGNSLDNRDFIKTMYEQLWLSQRQGVGERLLLTSIFSVMFASSLALIKDSLFDCSNLYLIVFLMLLSIFALLFTLKVDSVLKARERAADNIVIHFKLLHFNPRYKKHWVNNIPIGKFFPIFFTMCFCFLLFIFIKTIFANNFLALVIPTVLFLLAVIFLWRIKYGLKTE